MIRTRPGRCLICRCSDAHGCASGCWWVDDWHTLCSRCAHAMALLVLALRRKGKNNEQGTHTPARRDRPRRELARSAGQGGICAMPVEAGDIPWERVSETGRDMWRTVGQAVLDTITSGSGKQRGDFSVSSIFGYDTQQPYVNVETSMSPMQCSPAKAREMALMLLEAADAAESDAVLVGYAKAVLDLDERGAAQLLGQLRQYRETQRGKAADTA